MSQRDPLTNREREILELVATGLTNQEIAEQVFLALGTVKNHASNILSKLGARNRAHAVALYYCQGPGGW